jgi:hypothetical protein
LGFSFKRGFSLKKVSRTVSKDDSKESKDNCLKKLDAMLKGAFVKIKEEIEDHKESINQNTNEIQSNYEYLCRLEMKIDKLAERIDEISLFLNHPSSVRQQDVLELTSNEQRVFVVLYANDSGMLTYQDIAARTGFTENLVICYIGNLVAKGVPVIKRYLGGQMQLAIDPTFKDLQAKGNIVRLNQSVSHTLFV